MLDLLIVNPNASPLAYGNLADTNLPAKEPPLWARLIAGYVRDEGFSVRIIDADAQGLSVEQTVHRIDAYSPRLVCVCAYGHQPSASTQTMPAVKALMKRLHYHITILVGGHASALPEQTWREVGTGYVCDGEGPETIVQLLRRMTCLDDKRQPSDIPGLVYNGAVSVQRNQPAPLLPVERLHGNTWDLLPMDCYRAHNWQCFGENGRQPYASIYTSLGCPYKCGFCCINAPFHANQYRMRKPADVVAEIEMLYQRHGVRILKIIDEMFVLNVAHYTEICHRILQSSILYGADLNIWAYARVDTVKLGTLKLMRSAGIRWLALGIESESEYVRDGSNKRLKTNDIERVVRDIQNAGINVIANYIFGLPDDTMESMAATLDLAKRLNTEFANFYCAMAYPGSPLYDEAIAKGWPLPSSWEGYSQHGYRTFPLPSRVLGNRDILRFRDNAFRDYFTNPAYLDMIALKFGIEAEGQIMDMTSKALRRELLEDTIAPAPVTSS